MAYNISNVIFYSSNTVRLFSNWSTFVDAYVDGDYLHISSGGYAVYNFSNLYYNGLKASKNRKLTLDIEANFTLNFKYQNYIEARFIGGYVSGSKEYSSCNIFDSKTNIVLPFEDSDFSSLSLLLINHTDSEIIVKACSVLRSQDINSSQIGEAIGWGVTLSQVIAYQDGCELYYDGNETPDKLWWMEDSDGLFSGINVNNERMIKFSRKNEILLD